MNEIVEAQTEFAFNVLRETGLGASMVVSPISISIALAMVLFGAMNNTKTEIHNVLAKGNGAVRSSNPGISEIRQFRDSVIFESKVV